MKRIDLSGTWSLRAVAGPSPLEPAEVEMQVPGDTISALLASQKIRHPYQGTNELKLQWVGLCDWELTREFHVSHEPAEAAWFVAESLDTIAEVSVNGTTVGTSDNMFVPLTARLPAGLLKSGPNTLTVRIAAPERVAVERSERLRYPVPHTEFPIQSPNRNLVRKVQCHAGWDWGPSLMVSGIYGEIGITFSEAPLLHQVSAQPRKSARGWEIVAEPFFTAPDDPLAAAPQRDVTVEVLAPDGSRVAVRSERVAIWPDGHAEPIVLAVDDPLLWWPNGMGPQPLYTVAVESGSQRLEKRVGFRELELDRTPDQQGESFTFVVNGRPVFAKGSNWIPLDALPGQASEERLRWLLESAAAANHTMIRVWGGGTYESDRFYDLCDELGLMVWQDFMFACSLYPDADWFLESVASEVRYQVNRLKDRASVALWCGNNENVAALNWYNQSRTSRDRYLVAYDRLNEGVVGRICRECDPLRSFWPSSPADGVDAFGDNWDDDASGDMHYWGVWHGGRPFGAYRQVTPRFCSEFGFQSFSSPSEIETFADPSEWNVTSRVMEHHQRHDRGNGLIMLTMNRYYRFPDGFEHQLYLSQVQQAHAIRTAVEYWRSQMPRCMGALYWQLNDVWPVASWASIEYSGKWKLLHYASARFFSPLTVVAVPYDEDAAVTNEDHAPRSWRIYVINETGTDHRGTLHIRTLAYGGDEVHSTTLDGVTARDGAASHLYTVEQGDSGIDPDAAFVVVDFEPSADSVGTGATNALRTQFYLDHPKRSRIGAATVTHTVKQDEGGLSVILSTDVPAFEVTVDAGAIPGRFSDNMIPLLPDEPVELRWVGRTDVTEAEFASTIRVTHLGQIGEAK